jgi:hypothetical protein
MRGEVLPNEEIKGGIIMTTTTLDRANVGRFNIGDKVRRINCDNGYPDGRNLKVGTVGIVAEIEFDDFIVLDINGEIWGGNDPENLELVE